MSLKNNIADNRKPLNMSAEEWALVKKIDKETDPVKKAKLEADWRDLDNAECDAAEQRLAMSELNYKKWGR